MKTKKIIKDLIKNSELSISDKIDAEILLDRAFMSKENQGTREIIKTLEELYNDLGDKDTFTNQEYLAPIYKDLLLRVINEYKLRVRKNDYLLNTEYFQPFDDYTPITFEKLLGSLCKKGTKVEKTEDGKIIFTPDDPDILDRHLKIAKEDGMGYASGGFEDVFSGYQGDDNNIYLWV